jgi:hypothetical protein
VALFPDLAKSAALVSMFGQTSLAVCGQGMVDFSQEVLGLLGNFLTANSYDLNHGVAIFYYHYDQHFE